MNRVFVCLFVFFATSYGEVSQITTLLIFFTYQTKIKSFYKTALGRAGPTDLHSLLGTVLFLCYVKHTHTHTHPHTHPSQMQYVNIQKNSKRIVVYF